MVQSVPIQKGLSTLHLSGLISLPSSWFVILPNNTAGSYSMSNKLSSQNIGYLHPLGGQHTKTVRTTEIGNQATNE